MKLYTKLEKTNDKKEFVTNLLILRPSSYFKPIKNVTADFINLQCEKDCQRSFSDLFVIFNTEYEGSTEEDFAKLLHEVCIENNLVGRYCNTVRKNVFGYRKSKYFERDKRFPIFAERDSLVGHDHRYNEIDACKDGYTAQKIQNLIDG